MVDDEPMVRRAITLMLKYAGHKPETVDNGEAALTLLGERKFDIVMTDFHMPDMRGDQLITRIRAMLPEQPIILATAFAEEYTASRPPVEKVVAILLKPFSFKDLTAAIELVMIQEPPLSVVKD